MNEGEEEGSEGGGGAGGEEEGLVEGEPLPDVDAGWPLDRSSARRGGSVAHNLTEWAAPTAG